MTAHQIAILFSIWSKTDREWMLYSWKQPLEPPSKISKGPAVGTFPHFFILLYIVFLFIGINVPRSRFLPVKKTQDLLLVMSNLYDLADGHLTLSSKRSFPTTPLVKLGSSFDKVR